MKVKDLGPGLQFRYLVVDENNKAHAVFADEKKADAWVMQNRIAKRKNGL